MPNLELPFSISEYATRLDLVRKSMDDNNIEVLFTCDPSNMAWLSGYDGWSFYVHQGVLIGPEGDPIRSEERRVGKECRSRWSPYH